MKPRRWWLRLRLSLGRGLGRAYGDAAQNGGGLVISSDNLQDCGEPGPVMEVAAGVSIDEILRRSVPAGYFVPVTPGTRYVSVGGALASDIQGKNHHADGALSAHTESIDMVLASGEQVTIGPDADPELFWATAGGMGLTGLITGARLRMRPIESSQLLVDTTRAEDLDDLIAAMYEADAHARYSVAWVDTLATGRKLGRSVLTIGDFAAVADLPAKQRGNPLAYSPAKPLPAPKVMPNQALNRWTVAGFNEMWFRKAPKRKTGELQSIATFFHPLDGVADWNHIYGSRGFLQYQVIVPDGQEDVIRRLLEQFAGARCPVFLAVLKRFGPEGPSPITFALKGLDPGPGHPHRRAGLERAARRDGRRGRGRRWPDLPDQGLADVPGDVPGDVPAGQGVRGGARPGGPRAQIPQ